MRPLRFLLSLLSFVLAFFLLLFAGPWSSRGSGGSTHNLDDRTNIGTYFSWHTPSSLFPPSAIISITDDNSTNFVARPAAFGPLLPAKSLSGQLWIGSGFGDDHLGRGDGELGCSDVPGWDDGSWTSVTMNPKKAVSDYRISTDSSNPLAGHSKRSLVTDEDDNDDQDREHGKGHPSEDDGTDDYLHHPLPASDGLKQNGEAAGKTKKPTHADIQSLQESAEIAGKIVLLSRGGCGFLEKVKWVQRRGGIALVVGDDIRGGPLVTMYARGDTSNVTIPSLFTSHTTAQLLSSLMPSGSSNGAVDDASRLGPALGAETENKPGSQKHEDADKPNFTTTKPALPKATANAHTKSRGKNDKTHAAPDESHHAHRGWFSFLFGSRTDNGHDSRRPPSSGNIGWVLQEEFEDDEYGRGKTPKSASSSTSSSSGPTPTPKKMPSDGFQIGIQDWRDPDLVAEQREQLLGRTSTMSSSSSRASKNTQAAPTSLEGGSITPGSGSYGKANHEVLDMSISGKTNADHGTTSHEMDYQEDGSRGWLGRLLHSESDQDVEAGSGARVPADSVSKSSTHSSKTHGYDHRHHHGAGVPQMHEGLWVTLSPTSMSTSPFFDTLLVLVVSPLVTLTVVYALLLLRSRIRRRRWRAPKSVVERLPVRTYQTISSSTASTTSSTSSHASVTTPLLPHASRPIRTRPRPRARTTSGVPQASSMRSEETASPSLEQIEEKRAAGLAEWRRRYGGKQKECVVCLEEYVDGVSRVMSLPCGHEFHAECITPWLTTRRRTCPICKGDVVRSLARSAGSSTSPPAQQYLDEDSDAEQDVQEQAVSTVNDDPASQLPVSREDEAFSDLERGVVPDRTR